MILNVNTKNQIKINAVKNTVVLYPDLFINPEVIAFEDPSLDLYGNPKTLKETIAGAAGRAVNAFVNCDYSVGIEDGLMEVPCESGWMNVCVAAVYDGKNTYIGLSPAFEYPKNVLELVRSGKADASQAFKQLGLTEHEKIGAVPGGIVGFLTNNRLTREDYTKYALEMALIKIEQKNLYR
jgi:inosine/xanthosine triphosphatase